MTHQEEETELLFGSLINFFVSIPGNVDSTETDSNC